MLTAKDVGGVMGMMPAFATDDATGHQRHADHRR